MEDNEEDIASLFSAIICCSTSFSKNIKKKEK
jgi:hypothetical protein